MSGKGKTKHYKTPGFQRRKNYRVTLDRVSDLGYVTSNVVRSSKAGDLVRNRAYEEHRQKVKGAIQRLKRQVTWARLGYQTEAARNEAAFKTLDTKKGE